MTSSNLFLFVMTLLLITVQAQEEEEEEFDLITITTAYGGLRGRTATNHNVTFNGFIGIPYAKPPVDSLRFEPPQRLDHWDGIKDALSFGAVCPQIYDPAGDPDLIPSEDCLYLDVWVSGNITDAIADPLPVMVYIHGGGYFVGSTRGYTGSAITTVGEPIVYVGIQYRLGILGFITSGDNEIPGENGLKDQVFALQWIQENIEYFGGDKNRVTIFGESAGGDSVLMHMISPMSRGLFHRAIAQSAPSSWRLPRKELYQGYVYNIALDNGCTEENLQECIRTIPWEILMAQFYLPIRVIDGEFFQDEPWKYYRDGHINDAELIIGFTSDDGELIAVNLFPDDYLTTGISDTDIYKRVSAFLLEAVLSDRNIMGENTHYDDISKSDIDIESSFNYTIARYGKGLVNMDDLVGILLGKYTAFGDPIQNARGLLDALLDAAFLSFPLWVALQASLHGKSVRVYEFDHRSPTLYPISGPDEVPLYAPHGSEVYYVFGVALSAFFSIHQTDEELLLAASMIKAWTSFATDGNPVYYSMDGAEEAWPEFTADEKNYLVFDTSLSADSVKDLATTYMPAVDFWLAIEALAVFEDDEGGENENDSSEEFETDIFKLDESQADLAVIVLTCVSVLLLLIVLCLCCRLRNTSKSSKYTT